MNELIDVLGYGALFMLMVCVNTVIADKIAQVIHRLAQTNTCAPGVPPFLQSKKDIKKALARPVPEWVTVILNQSR